MQLFHGWKDSFKIFAPRNLGLFLLVSLNAARQAYKVWFKVSWPLFVLFVAQQFFVMWIAPAHWGLEFIEKMVQLILLVTLILSLRPSVKRKSLAYFYDYRWHVGLLVLIGGADFIIARECMHVPIVLGNLLHPLVLIFLATLLLFYYDTPGRIRDFFLSCWRTCMLLLYGLPFYVVMLAVMSLCYWLIVLVVGHLYIPLACLFHVDPLNGWYGFVYFLCVFFIIFVFSMLPLACVATFYTKRIHDYSERFFG
jgi:hypothetical protein